MKLVTKLTFVAALAALLPLRAQATPILVGAGDLTGANANRSTPTNIVAADGWTAPNGGFKVAWNITFSGGLWHYSYTFTNADGSTLDPAISHMLLEVSESITPTNVGVIITNDNFALVGPQTWGADPNSPNSTSPGENNGNPNLPADIYAIKADTGQSTYTFDSTNAPIWGDFYVKDGKHDGLVATAWNSGFGTDPTNTTTNFSPWIPVPDTVPGPGTVPLPGSLALFLVGAAAFRLARRK